MALRVVRSETMTDDRVLHPLPTADIIPSSSGEEVTRYTHKKRGTNYRELFHGTMQVSAADVADPVLREAMVEHFDGKPVVVYQSESDSDRPPDVRLVSEFEDGRFEKLPDGTTHWADDEGRIGCFKSHLDCAINEVEELRLDLQDADDLIEVMRNLLIRVADAVNGPPPEGTWHDWSSLPDKVAEMASQKVKVTHSVAAPIEIEEDEYDVTLMQKQPWSFWPLAVGFRCSVCSAEVRSTLVGLICEQDHTAEAIKAGLPTVIVGEPIVSAP